MKKIILAGLLTVSSMCLFAQNHHNNTPYKSESSRVIRMNDTIYQETTTIFVEGLSTITKVEAKALYPIPKHLKKLNSDIIDKIVRENKPFKTTKWSWFIVWKRTYTKDNIFNQFSWVSIKNLLIGYGCILLIFIAVAALSERGFKKGFKALAKVNPQKDLNKEDRWLILIWGVLISLIAWFIESYTNAADIDVWFGLMVYYLVILGLYYAIVKGVKILKNKKWKQKN